jgi:hypothetical protein
MPYPGDGSDILGGCSANETLLGRVGLWCVHGHA